MCLLFCCTVCNTAAGSYTAIVSLSDMRVGLRYCSSPVAAVRQHVMSWPAAQLVSHIQQTRKGQHTKLAIDHLSACCSTGEGDVELLGHASPGCFVQLLCTTHLILSLQTSLNLLCPACAAYCVRLIVASVQAGFAELQPLIMFNMHGRQNSILAAMHLCLA